MNAIETPEAPTNGVSERVMPWHRIGKEAWIKKIQRANRRTRRAKAKLAKVKRRGPYKKAASVHNEAQAVLAVIVFNLDRGYSVESEGSLHLMARKAILG